MTMISMHAGNAALFGRSPTRPVPVRRPAPVRIVPSPAAERMAGRALGAASRFALALVPFSFLAWVFAGH